MKGRSWRAVEGAELAVPTTSKPNESTESITGPFAPANGSAGIFRESLPIALRDVVVDVLRSRCARQPLDRIFTFLPEGEDYEQHLTSAELDRAARAIAATLQRKLKAGDRALLLYPPSLEFITSFFGCLYAGVIAVPAYLPPPGRGERGLLRLINIVEDSQPAAIITTSSIRAFADNMVGSIPGLHEPVWVTTDALEPGAESEWQEPSLTADSLAFLQYTSGSTGSPKGVMVTHRNLMHNVRLMQRALRLDQSTTLVSWLPPYHDMGLVAKIVTPSVTGMHAVHMPTMSFLQSPVRWLRAITKYGGTTTAAPNFAFDLCARKVSETERATLDLSTLSMVANGSEPVRHDSIRRFSDAFACCGFRPQAIVPVYGLAEATLYVSGAPTSQPPAPYSFDSDDLERGVARSIPSGSQGERVLISCGHALDQTVTIVDPERATVCSPGRIGEIWISGGSVASGYWQRPEETRHAFQARPAGGGDATYLRTGDLGFQTDEGLFVVGRIKDLLIIAGQNHYPQDIEWTVERADLRIRPGCTVAFGVDVDAEERLVVAVEIREGARIDVEREREEVAHAIRRAVMLDHQLAVHDIVLLPPGSIPKTSSGKLQRSASRQDYRSGKSPWDLRVGVR